MSKKLGLALGSGGSRGVTHLGVLNALEEAGIKPDFIAGCSMGSVVGACYSKGMSVESMLSAVLKLKTFDLLDISAIPVSRGGLLKGNKMLKLLLNNLGDITFADLNIPFCCVATDLLSGRLVTFSEGSVAKAVQASSAIPTLFRPVKHNGMVLVDGGVLCRIPVRQVKDMGADVVIAVDALANTAESVKKVPNIVQLVLRTFDIMDYNQTTLREKTEGELCDLTLRPLMLGMSQYAVKDMEKAFVEGYEAAANNMDKIKELLK